MRKEKAISSKSKDKKKKRALSIIICKKIVCNKTWLYNKGTYAFYIYFKNNIMVYNI